MGERIMLSEARVRAAVDGGDDELRIYDSKVPPLLLWRRAGGKPRWYVFLRVGGRMRRVPVGEANTWPLVPVEQARDLARGIVADLVGGGDPVAARREKRRRDVGGLAPFAEAARVHAAALDGKGRSARHVAEIKRVAAGVQAAGLTDLANPRAREIAERWILAQTCGPLTQRRYATHLRAIGRRAVRRWPELARDPFLALEVGSSVLPPPPVFELSEMRTLVSDKALVDIVGRLVAFALYTGCRLREATFARWSRVDLERATFLVIPPNAAERAAGEAVKRDRARAVALQPELVVLLRRWQDDADGDWLWPEPVRDLGRHSTSALRAHLTALGITQGERVFHSLRHSHCSLALAAGEDGLRLRLSVGHAGDAMTAHYAAQAMRWRGEVAGWGGVWRLRGR